MCGWGSFLVDLEGVGVGAVCGGEACVESSFAAGKPSPTPSYSAV